MDLARRDFLKIVGAAGTTAALSGCSEPTRKLIPYVNSPEDIIPGKAAWFATTCRECPAGCGILAKNKDGRVIKVEGNPLHPINAGKLCARGQAALHGLYNPDRFTGPLFENDSGRLEPVSWEKAEEVFVRRLTEIVSQNRGDRIVVLTGLDTGAMDDLVDLWLAELGHPDGHVVYEPFGYEPLRKANSVVFGRDAIPSYRIDRADFLISFGAGFLETWLSNVEYARQFASFRADRETGKNLFTYVGPRLSMTAANADLWISVRPGDELLVGLGILRVILEGDFPMDVEPDRKAMMASITEGWTLSKIAVQTGVDEETLRRVALRVARSERPLAIAEGLSLSGPNATETAVVANLLSTLKSGPLEAMDFERPSSYSRVAPARAMKDLSERMKKGEVDLLLIHGANPVFSLPASWDFAGSMKAVPTVVSFSSAPDETTNLAGLIMPTSTPLESWGDYSPRKGVAGLMQPVMGPVFSTKHPGDILISAGRKVKGENGFAWADFHELLRTAWKEKWQATGADIPFESFWAKSLERGGAWETEKGEARRPLISSVGPFAFPAPPTAVASAPSPPAASSSSPHPSGGHPNELHFTAYPTVQFFDGRTANRLWIQELPDPITQATWGAWVEIHPETAERLNVRQGDVLLIESPYGKIEAPALPIFSVPPSTAAIPIGQGHTAYGRFANGLPANPMDLFPPDIDGLSEGIARPAFRVTLKKLDKRSPVAHTDGSFFQEGREILQFTATEEYSKARASGQKPQIDYPLPQGYDPHVDFYPAHGHGDYRWSMVVDLDRCIGCGACVVACYAENNVAVVGKEQVLKGREMSWLRVQRYFLDDQKSARWLVMLCQHCDSAPCESVCPVFAPHHSVDGLNNQIYNRCFGTRFCSQNDPYKVRRFNWFTFTRPTPLEWQLNPDVTVRQKGVMEKCSFCIQRIAEAKIEARKKGRNTVQDGEFTTACAQTCPTGALIFGNLKDPDSRVSKLIQDPRAYQVLRHLNTKPAVIYLKRITQPV